MTRTDAICKKINAGSWGNNQTVLRVYWSLTETWSANTEKWSLAMLLILLPSCAKPSRLSGVHHAASSHINLSLIFIMSSGICIVKWSDYSVLDPRVFSTFIWIINVKIILEGLQTNYFKLLLYKGAGSNCSTPLPNTLKHLFPSANENFVQAWCWFISPTASFYAHFKFNIELGGF